MNSSPRNPFVMIYREVALDYFYRMGGAGRYQGFQEWHPALLTLGCALEATSEYSFGDLGLIWSRLPPEIVERCDGLRERVTQSFVKALQPFELKLDCIKLGADLLLEELSVGSRGEPLSIEKSLTLKRVKLEFDLALSGI
ncbi:hypothetical protein OAI26_02045 [Sulfitobacter sp.]|nr:hypothetical protein [Sulfitobacter sp.]